MKKKLPIITADFATLVGGGGYFVDKTRYIPVLEELNFPNIFFLRPRRFGKSLFLSMLEYYYGVQYSVRFEELFGEYFIGRPENVTPLKNSYYILKFNFSGIDTGIEVEIRYKFDEEVRSAIEIFLHTYGVGKEDEIRRTLEASDSASLLRRFITLFVKYKLGSKIFVLVDEYDHFTNELFSFNRGHFSEAVAGNGWVRKFYEVIKQYMGDGIIGRFFATGVTPVTLDSMTSGFNVAKNISLDSRFNEMAGFTRLELEELVRNTLWEEEKFNLDQVLDDMRHWFNGSRFSPDGEEKIYNPQLAVNFLSDFSARFEYPRNFIDVNVVSDFRKISGILAPLPAEKRDKLIEDVLDDEIIKDGLTIQYNLESDFSRKDAVSLLYYNGLLSIEDSFADLMTYTIPNYVIKQLYWEYFRADLEKKNAFTIDHNAIGEMLREMSIDGVINRLVNYINVVIGSISFRDLQGFSEKHLKMIVMTIFAGNKLFFAFSEKEVVAGYVDILLKRTGFNPGRFNHLIELKYLKADSINNLEIVRQEGILQACRYRDSLPKEEQENLKTWLIICSGKKVVEYYSV
ncbi:MAG: hypothetical protein HBSAPP04_12720 [Ignavibacteriaceae bacterium]|nr:MAG: hypothetical protein HBSAPP04_12720 [Ignavibacteriaceae bacterium]